MRNQFLEMQIRADDFRRAWPNALSRALQEAGELVDGLQTQREAIEELAALAPQMLHAAEARMAESADKHVLAIKAASEEMKAAQTEFLKTSEAEFSKIQRARDAAEAARTDIHLAQKKLDKERTEFNSMSLFRRIFIRA
jgi:hypothetical protein